MEELLNNLNAKQKEAVLAQEGPVLILAGPGSGKTKTLTHKIAYLIASGVNPQNILAVTFTNKAADEMKSRIAELLTQPTTIPTVGTFHSICARFLRENAPRLGYGRDFLIYDDQDQTSVLKNVIKDLDIDPKQFSPQKVSSQISKAKDFLLDPQNYQEQAENYFQRQIAKIYSAYQQKLRQNNAMDFGDLIMQTVVLLRKNPDVLEKYQKRFQYILVDEYQDTNTAQYEWLNLLAQKAKNVCVVGDDAQAIYSWRNANYENILNFQNDWPNARVFKLEQNYRSTQNIVKAASELIKNNQHGYPKELWTQNKAGEALKIYELASADAEAEFIVNQIKQVGRKLNNFVVLYRTNAQSRAVEQAFLRHDIPYKIVGGVKFYQRQEVKDVLAFLRLVQNKKDEASWQRLERLRLSDLAKKLPSRPTNKRSAIEALYKDFENYFPHAENLTEFTKYVVEKANFAGMLRDKTPKGEERWQNVQELLSATTKYAQHTMGRALEIFLEDVSLMQDADNVEYSSKLVHLMTLHMAKGLEFPFVFIAGCEEGILPHANSMGSPAELEEERRLMYVGITRAKEMAYLLFARYRVVFGEIKGGIPSSFLAEIPQEYVQFESLAQDYLDDDVIEV